MGKLVAQIPNEDPERLKRVLDAKWRTIGVDTEALARQAEEKKERERLEKERDEAFAQLSNYWADQLALQQQEADRLRKQVAQDLESFRLTQQLKHTRREWDINRPDGKKIDDPARTGDDDARLGAASMQRFAGEDLSAADRKRAQMEQSKQWWEEQAAHKAALKAAQAEAEAAYAELARYQDMLQLQAKRDEQTIRRELNQTTAEVNKRLAEERRLKELQDKAAELAANLAEIDATLNSPLMTEDPNLAASAMSPYRVRRDHYKGMTDTERRAILATQLAQMEENKARAAAQAAEEARRRGLIEDERKRLLREAAELREFLPRGVIRDQADLAYVNEVAAQLQRTGLGGR
uniref:Uncharacterized protein n=1 Tax=Chlamydomonas leiostraca TaxID=1034604 RepID=A0A7S0S1F6_9CHLO|mmetsp:Transcript_4509/g.11149  ORF Transcript_4509/g.11149 Transcript_4509/m.11149 type:complete len:351 (+) Transcript_4509:95-1147(+)